MRRESPWEVHCFGGGCVHTWLDIVSLPLPSTHTVQLAAYILRHISLYVQGLSGLAPQSSLILFIAQSSDSIAGCLSFPVLSYVVAVPSHCLSPSPFLAPDLYTRAP